MPSILPTFPDNELFTVTVDLDGQDYTLRFEWKNNLQGWYLDISLPDGTHINQGRRLSPGSTPLVGLDGPPGILFVQGPDPYTQLQLGDDLLLFYFDESELVGG